jgi:hypothetical protein
MSRRINSGNQVTRTERGWGRHFICADRCLFRRNTLLESGEVRVVVSTVGRMIDPTTDKVEIIGAFRYYETMCFLAKYSNGYWDADVSKEITDINLPWQVENSPYDDHNTDNLANNQHEAIVDELTERLRKGIPLEVYYGESEDVS